MRRLLAIGALLAIMPACATPKTRLSPTTAAMIAVRQVHQQVDPANTYRADEVVLSEGVYMVLLQASQLSLGGTVRVWVDSESGRVLRTLVEP